MVLHVYITRGGGVKVFLPGEKSAVYLKGLTKRENIKALFRYLNLQRNGEISEKNVGSPQKAEKNQTSFYLADYHPSCQSRLRRDVSVLHDGHARLIEKAFEIAGSGKSTSGLLRMRCFKKATSREL
jgi:hypothetical protein